MSKIVALLRRDLAKKRPTYWISLVVHVALGLYVGHWISDSQTWIEWRYKASHIVQGLSSKVSLPKYTAIVRIGDAEYWTPPLSARVPIDRAYLARLIDTIAQGNPVLIALDFDMRSPQPDGSLVEFPAFEDESRALIRQIRETSRAHQIVLPRTTWSESGHSYRVESDIWNLEPDLLELPNVRSGYIALPEDIRQIPLAVPLENAPPLDSFSLAIARARAENVTDLLIVIGGRENLPFANYIAKDGFRDYAPTATQVLGATDDTLKTWFNGRVAIIGAEWSTLAAKRGAPVDLYSTPVGSIPGVFVHANFVEALLDQRTFEPAPEWLVQCLEATLLLACILVFALEVPTLTKVGTWALVMASLVVTNYVALHNFGRFFDFFVPLVMLMSHVAIEQIDHWRKESRAHHRCRTQVAAVLIALVGASTFLAAGESNATVDSGHLLRDSASTERLVQNTAQPGSLTPNGESDPMGQPVVHEGVKSGTNPGGPRDREIDSMGQPVVKKGVKSGTTILPGGTRRDSPRPTP